MINRIVIDNFKSIRHLDLELKPLNVLIGANGSGKSNLIGFLEMVREIFAERLQAFVAENGGANELMYFGLKHSEQLSGSIYFGDSYLRYSFELKPTKQYALLFEKDEIEVVSDSPFNDNEIFDYASNEPESEASVGFFVDLHDGFNLKKRLWKKERNDLFRGFFTSNGIEAEIYHFYDTGFRSNLRAISNINDNQKLRSDGKNLAAFLYFLQVKHPKNFTRIEANVKSVAPFFKSFNLKPNNLNPESILLEWRHEFKDEYFNAQHLSDGTIRFIALATLLLQPDPPKLIVIDEPELGLHPFAIEKLAALIRTASKHTQVIIATQSPALVSNFQPEDIVTVDWKDGQSTFQRHTTEELAVWLEDYSLGEIWDKNVIGGRP
jgi:predicted ATPase